ncbi:MAG: hypothetical protein ABI399_02530 [Bauldia sp.]
MRRSRFARLAAALAAVATLGACTLTQGPPIVSPTKVLSMTSAPIKGAAAKFAFAPITGVPSELLQTLNSAMTKHAAARHLTIVPDGDPTATYLVKGYLSAIGDNRGTLLVYVWDVLGQDGQRLRRISGQEIGGGARADPWTGISKELIAASGQSTIDELLAWSD